VGSIIEIEPNSAVVKEGGTAAFSVSASPAKNGEKTSYQWQKLSDIAGSDAAYWADLTENANGAEYKIHDVKNEDNNTKYRCIVSHSKNHSMGSSQTTRVVSLFVSGESDTYPTETDISLSGKGYGELKGQYFAAKKGKALEIVANTNYYAGGISIPVPNGDVSFYKYELTDEKTLKNDSGVKIGNKITDGKAQMTWKPDKTGAFQIVAVYEGGISGVGGEKNSDSQTKGAVDSGKQKTDSALSTQDAVTAQQTAESPPPKLNPSRSEVVTVNIADPKITAYEISYVLNGGENDPQNPSYISSNGDIVTLNDGTKAYSKFIGWFANEKFTGKKITELDPAKMDGKATLYAKFEDISYKISYMMGAPISYSNTNPAKYSYYSPVNLFPPHAAGYSFLGWYSNHAKTKPVYVLPTGTPKDITLYAKWQEIPYSIIYIMDGGTNNEDNPSMFTASEEVVLKDGEKNGASFAGWFLDADFKNEITKIPAGTAANLTLYAKWKEQG
jgi:uncharacterized repeat protein (TIGR02543 family)